MKLHELLAVEGNLENQAAKVTAELKASFEKKRHLFEEKTVVFTPNGEGQNQVVEAQSNIQTTVLKELELLTPFLAKSFDASYRVSEANTVARADVVLDLDNGAVTLLTGVPATTLLELEKRLNDITNLVNAIPTLDPAKGFNPDSQKGLGYYQARKINKTRTKKEKVVLVKYQATKEHPAQTELIDQDIPVGTVQEQEWSGLITPSEKSDLLSRVETLARAVRQARSRANEVEVDTSKKIANKLLNFIFQGKS